MVFIGSLHKKGIWTTLLIILSESITLTKAVTFWSSYQSWSNQFGTNSNNNNSHQSHCTTPTKKRGIHPLSRLTDFDIKSAFSRKTNSNNDDDECQSTDTSVLPSTKTSILRPRNRAARSNAKASCTTKMIHCCQQNCLSCFADDNTTTQFSHASTTLDIRGGHAQHADHILKDLPPSASVVTPYGIPLNMWKVIFQFFLTTMNVLCWYLPLKNKKLSENKLGMSLANAFSGGVFLSLAFGHLIPECVHGFEGYNEAFPFMVVLGGYLLIFFVEKVAFDAHSLMHVEEGDPVKSNSNGKKGELVEKEGGGEGGLNSGRSAVILLGALAVHSILEMTALGLADTFGDSALLSLSIALHQPAESIALLVAFLKSGMPHPQIIKYLSIFSTMGPIGVALGMCVKEFAAPIVDSIMLATVAGTFVYVGATEVIPEEWEDQEDKWKKFFALVAGIVSIFGITQYTMTLEGH